ncbi:MAG: hypothetical protein QGG42_11425 [Phycisphaerae bacterium]|jgi:hypothetical protein|nr:hypothetical protein [Phycisphaerae bacterium]
MNRYAFPAVLLTIALQISFAQAADKSIHIPAGRSVSSSWVVTDSAGFRWDIYLNYGQVNDGTNDAYDGGMQMQISGSTMSVSQQGRLSKTGDEVEIGPWRRGSVNIYRRIYVDKKIGYCRWIDIFENTSTSAQTLTLRYYSNMGSSTQSSFTTSGQTSLTAKDWGIITGSSSGSRPSVVHIFATKNAKIRPTFQFRIGDDNLYYHQSLKIPPKKTVALCFIEAQRRPMSAAQKFLKEFKVERELKKVPAPLRRLILNMGGAMLTLGSLELPRNEKHDMLVQRGGNELLGAIQNTEYVIDTLQGKVTLPADRVVGLHAPVGAGDRVKLGLVDGQVLVGKLTAEAIKLKLVNGNMMSLTIDMIDTAAYRVSPQRPEEIAFRRPMIVLRNGQQLFFKQTDVDWGFHTQYGRVNLQPKNLNAITLDTPDGGLHRAIFSNGSVLSGLLVQEDLNVALDLGGKLSVKRYLAQRFAMPTLPYAGSEPGQLQLRNEDTLAGRIADKVIKIETTDNEQVNVQSADIATVTAPEGASLGVLRIKLHNGTTVDGTLVGKTIAFQITPGPKLDVYVGHIMEINQSKPSGSNSPTTNPATVKPPVPKPPVTVPTTPVSPDPFGKEPARRAKLLKLRQAEKAKAAEAAAKAAEIKAAAEAAAADEAAKAAADRAAAEAAKRAAAEAAAEAKKRAADRN